MSSVNTPRFSPWQLQETELPWSASAEEDARFSRFLKRGLIVFLLLGIPVALIPVPELTREQAERIPPQLARVILEEKTLPKPEPKPEPVKEKQPEKTEPEPEPEIEEEPPAVTVELAREKAANSGLLQMQDDLAAMRESVDIAEVSGGAELAASDAGSANTVDRSLISDRSRTASGGVNTGNLSRDTGGRALASRETTTVENAEATGAAREESRRARRQKSARTEGSIRSVMEANKGAVYAIYNRALRRDPTLQGKVTVQLVIEPNGAVSAIKVVSSELNNPALERKLLARIRLINFGAANVERATLNYSIDFLPS